MKVSKCIVCKEKAYVSKLSIPALCDNCIQKNIEIIKLKESVGN
jgi:hypothetical protein